MRVQKSLSTKKLKFEWDRAKAEATCKKHGVSFEVAKEVFRDPFVILRVDESSDYGDDRSVIALQFIRGRRDQDDSSLVTPGLGLTIRFFALCINLSTDHEPLATEVKTP